MAGPIISSSDSRAKTVLLFSGGILATLGLIVVLFLAWPAGDDSGSTSNTTTAVADGQRPTTTVEGATGEPSDRTTAGAPDPGEPVDLFEAGADAVLAELAEAAGGPTEAIEAIEVHIYPDYAFLAYRDVTNPANIDQRMWRDGEVGDAEPNPIGDRADADTQPKLFPLSEVDLKVLPQLTADAPTRFDLEVAVTHVIINRFLPFDERVLIRVYTYPTDGRSGGGYVQYTLDGSYVAVVQ